MKLKHMIMSCDRSSRPFRRVVSVTAASLKVAGVILEAVETRAPDLFTRAGYKAQVMTYLDELTADPAPAA